MSFIPLSQQCSWLPPCDLRSSRGPDNRERACPLGCQVAEFYKAWDRYGALSNFSAHPVRLPDGPIGASGALPRAPERQWRSVEHFYQAQKFAGGPCCMRAATLSGPFTLFHPVFPARFFEQIGHEADLCVAGQDPGPAGSLRESTTHPDGLQ